MNKYQKYRARMKVKPCEMKNATKSGGGTLAIRSLSECAEILGVSRQAAHQLERSAFHKIRAGLMEHLREMNPALAKLVEIER